jgi:hypothetical protein
MTNFTPGPSQLYFTVNDHIKAACREGIPSLSHRSKAFEAIYQHAETGLKTLLNIPDGFTMVFTASATEIWERSIQNLVRSSATHLVNGAFSKRYYEIAKQLQKQAVAINAVEGSAHTQTVFDPQTELIAITHNETSTGVSHNQDFIHQVRASNPAALIAIDAVSALPKKRRRRTPKADITGNSGKAAWGFTHLQRGFHALDCHRRYPLGVRQRATPAQRQLEREARDSRRLVQDQTERSRRMTDESCQCRAADRAGSDFRRAVCYDDNRIQPVRSPGERCCCGTHRHDRGRFGSTGSFQEVSRV